jgi:nicotinamidase-related amidase
MEPTSLPPPSARAGGVSAPVLAELVAPSRTALLTVEVQEVTVGTRSAVPALAEAVRATGMLDRIADLARAARAVGVRVIHCTAESRADRAGGNRNARLFALARKGPVDPSVFAVHRDVVVEPSDLVLPRLHGVSPLTGTSVDSILRNLGVTTIVATGVSVNIAIMGLAFEAVNLGYQIVLPRDAVAGVGDAYVDAVFEHTLSLVATVTNAAALLEAWGTEHTAGA